MKEYHKIQTVFLRDPADNFKTLLVGKWSKPEFEYLSGNKWVWTEKVDGTNIRLILDGADSRVGGKTDNATLHPHLFLRCREYLDAARAVGLDGLTLYGEGYGAGIQKSGGNYGSQKEFVLFDVCSADGMWLERANVEGIAGKVGVRVVPILGTSDLHEAIAVCRNGIVSQWGPFAAEGLVLRPAVELRNRRGERVITKLKTRDYEAAK